LKVALVITAAGVVALLTFVLLVRGARPGERPKDPPRPYRFPRAAGAAGPKKRLRPLLVWMALILLVGWLALALFSPGDKAPAPDGAGAGGLAEPAGPTASPRVQARFEENPPAPTPEEMEDIGRLEAEAEAALAQERAAAEAALAGPVAVAQAEAGLGFAPIPEDMVIVGAPMEMGARGLAPKISRMEPLGRSLDPEAPAPLKKPKIEPGTQPPEKERPRLSVPENLPRQAPPPAPKPLSERRYTIIVGSFSKEENARQLQGKFQDEGLPAEITPVTIDNKTFYRVMSGVFDDHASAEAYSRELRQKNLVSRPYIKAM
jgi:cell division septation protein DedD